MTLGYDTRPVLTLADLERFDPHAPEKGARRRFLCPLPACAGKPRDGGHRSLSLEVATGLWRCWRCGASGQLREQWQPRSPERRAVARRAFAVTPTAPVSPGNATPASPSQAPRGAAVADWRDQWERSAPLADTPGAAYLMHRGIPCALAVTGGVRFTTNWYGRPAVLFPLHDQAGRLVAVNGRHTDERTPKAHTGGDKRLGWFATVGGLHNQRLVITEAPLDALSLAACGVPAVALCGTAWPAWLPGAAAFRSVVVALDADPAGDKGAAELGAELRAFGAQVARLRPVEAVKDWNGALQEYGGPLLQWALRQQGAPSLTWDESVAEELLGTLFSQMAADEAAATHQSGEVAAWEQLSAAVEAAYAAHDLLALSRAISAYQRSLQL